MRCEHYWRDGILLAEQGRPDPHRESCLDCRREHEARGALVRELRRVGAGNGDPWWQARVWKKIEEPGRPTWISKVTPWTTALTAAGVLAVLVSSQGLLHRDEASHAVAAMGESVAGHQPGLEIVRAEHSMRSTSASIGDQVRVWADATQEVRIYRAEELVLRCTEQAAAASSPGCSRDGGGVMAEHAFALAGEYQVVIAPAGLLPPPDESAVVGAAAEPVRSFDRDLAAIIASGGTYQLRRISVR